MPLAVSDLDNATLEFYHQPSDLRHNVSEWGFTSDPARKSGAIENVRSLHLSKWLDNHVRGRIIPKVPHGGEHAHKIGPRVVMKMDIEGAEYEVLPDLITSGALCGSVDFWFGEFHRFEKELVNSYYNPLKKSKHCRTKFQEIDDEAYLRDGVSLPNITEES
jgi:Methyltransferase FkbM domain